MLAILKSLQRPNVVPSRCAHVGCTCGITRPGFAADSDLRRHNLRFVLHEPAWPVRLDMDASWCPWACTPHPRRTCRTGFVPAESDEWAEDAVYSVRASDDLIAGLGLDRAQPWLDRVLVRQDPDQGAWAPVCTAHTVVPFEVVAGHDLTWRGVEFGQVAVPGVLVAVQDAWITTCPATTWDVEALAVRTGSPINVVWVRLEIAFGAEATLPGGLVLKLPADRVVFASPIPQQVRDHRVRVQGAA
jgi:hypothetical protein